MVAYVAGVAESDKTDKMNNHLSLTYFKRKPWIEAVLVQLYLFLFKYQPILLFFPNGVRSMLIRKLRYWSSKIWA
jgi:hypothetical protein